MNKSKIVIIVSLVVLLLLMSVALYCVTNKNFNDEPKVSNVVNGPASDNLIFKKVTPENVVNDLLDSKIDVYLGTLSPKEANLLKNSNIEIYTAPSQYFGLNFNPAPSTKEIINPFSAQEFRFAVNNLINRQEIADTILKGYGTPKYIYLFDVSPDYQLVKDIVDSYDFSYNQNKALKDMEATMTKLGATKKDNKWYFNAKPVVVKIMIYSGTAYGEVKEVGDYVATQFENIGFAIEKIYYDDSTEIRPSDFDPKDLTWNISIGTGIYFGASKYDDYSIIATSPFMKSLSGSEKEGAWNYQNEKLDAIGKKLFSGEYNDENEWQSLFREGMKEIITNAYSIELVTKNQIFAANKNVLGISPSKYVGIRALQNFREMYIPNKDSLIIGTEETYKKDDPFNYYWFATNIYRMDMKQCLRDFGGWNNQNTLEYENYRWDYQLTTAGPKGKLDVPVDAFMWNSSQGKWVSVGSDVVATTKVNFDLSKYIGTKWHDGSVISWADVLYTLYSNQETVFNKKWNEISESNPSSISKIKAFRIVGDKNIEIYLDAWHFDEGMIVDQALFTSNNWLLYAATNKLIYEDNSMMASLSKAKKYNVPAMNLLNKEHIDIMLNKIDSLKAEDFNSIFTVGDINYLTLEEMDIKKQNIHSWADIHSNLIIGEGAFYLDSYNVNDETVNLKASRDSGYVFPLKNENKN